MNLAAEHFFLFYIVRRNRMQIITAGPFCEVLFIDNGIDGRNDLSYFLTLIPKCIEADEDNYLGLHLASLNP